VWHWCTGGKGAKGVMEARGLLEAACLRSPRSWAGASGHARALPKMVAVRLRVPCGLGFSKDPNRWEHITGGT
jgi:hypothetical protein